MSSTISSISNNIKHTTENNTEDNEVELVKDQIAWNTIDIIENEKERNELNNPQYKHESSSAIHNLDFFKSIEKIKAPLEWEGSVLDLSRDTFTARLKDLVDPDAPEEIAEFCYDDLQQGDETLVKPGAVFRWIIGTTISPKGGMNQKFSRLHFRKLPAWREEHFNKAQETTEDWIENIFVTDDFK